MKNKLVLIKNEYSELHPSNFLFSTNGQPSKSETKVKIKYDDNYLNIEFECLNNPYVNQNYMTIDNDDLYNQEVFEVFISPGFEDSKQYLEIELNPNNALWVGLIDNPTLGAEMQTLNRMVKNDEAQIVHSAQKNENSWFGKLSIPWAIIGDVTATEFRINFYRILSITNQADKNWISNGDNCEFICWSPTMAGDKPAFHRPKMFGFMSLT